MKNIVYYIAILICIPLVSLQAQTTEQIRSGTSNGAGWISGGSFATFGVAGQNGVATEVGGGNYSGSVGFVFLPVQPVVNALPIAIGTETEILIEAGAIYQLEGFDPEGEDLLFEIVRQPTLGSVNSASTTVNDKVSFDPIDGLMPNTVYHDSFEFKVIEAINGQESVPALVEFSFLLPDVPQNIVDLTLDGTDFTLTWEDPFVNDSYGVKMDFFDFTDPTTGVPEINVTTVDANSQTFALGNSNTIAFDIDASEFSDSYLFTGNIVIINVTLTTPNGFSDAETFVLDRNDPNNVTILASEDGLFFAFGSEQTVPENNEVTVQFSAVELGDFDLSQASLVLTGTPLLGTITQPILVKDTDVLLTWEATYTSTLEVGGIETIPFNVIHPDRDFTESAQVDLTIIDANDPPTLDPIFDQQILEDGVLQIEVSFSDPDSELSFEAVANNNADDVTIEVDGNMLTVTPDAEFSGTVSLTGIVTETDSEDSFTVSEGFTLEIIAQNDAPVLADIDNQTSNEDESVSVILSASDIDDDVLIFDYVASIDDPSIAEINISGDQLSIVPVANANGLVTVTVAADDKSGADNSESNAVVFTVDFAAVNDAPVATQQLPDINLVEGFTEYFIELSAFFSDVETAATALNYSATGNVGISISFSGSEARVTSPAFTGTEVINITAEDPEGLTASLSQSITITPLGVNIVPTGTFNNITVDEDFGSIEVDLAGVFEDTNDPAAVFTYQITGNNFVEVLVDNVNETATITSAQDINTDEELILVGITGGEASSLDFSLIINPVNDPPVLSDIANQSIFEDSDLVNLQLEASDVDDLQANLTVTAVSDDETLIANSDISITLDNGVYFLSATPQANVNGSANITVNVADADNSVESSFAVNILNVNDNPVQDISTINAATEDVNYSVDLAGLFSDIDGDVLSFEIPNLPAWLIQTGSTLAGTPLNDDTGTVDLLVNTSDGNGGSLQNTYELVINGVNDAPEFAVIASQTIQEDSQLTDFLIEVSDVDNLFSELMITASSSDESIIANSDISISTVGGFATISATPLADQNGSVTITIEANDGALSNTEDLVLVIEAVNDTPTVVTSEIPGATEDAAYSVDVSSYFADIDGDALTVSLSNNPSWLSIANNVVSGTPLNADVGAVTVTLSADDGNGGSVSETYDLVVSNVNDAPEIANASSDVSTNQNSVYTYTIPESVFSDPDVGDVLTLTVESFPDWLTLTGTTLEGTPGYDNIGTSTITIKATDVDGLSITDSFELEVIFVVYDVTFTASTEGVCPGETATIEATGAIDYNWYDVNGNLLQTDGNTFEIVAEAGLQILVEAKDDLDRANPERLTLDLIVNDVPDAPTVTEGDDLSVPDVAGLSYQWFIDGTEISGAAAQQPSYTPIETGEYYVVVTNASGCSAQSNAVTFTVITSLNLDQIDLTIYPVPVRNSLTLSSESNLSIYDLSITDLNGKLVPVKITRTINSIIFDTSGISAGIYLIRLFDDDQVIVKRFIKE